MEKKIKLSDNQYNIIVNNESEINLLRDKIIALEQNQKQIISVICECNDISEYKSINVDTDKKELIIKIK